MKDTSAPQSPHINFAYVEGLMPSDVQVRVIHKGYGDLFLEARYVGPLGAEEWIAAVELETTSLLFEEDETFHHFPEGARLLPDRLSTLLEALRSWSQYRNLSAVHYLGE